MKIDGLKIMSLAKEEARWPHGWCCVLGQDSLTVPRFPPLSRFSPTSHPREEFGGGARAPFPNSGW